MTTDGIPVYTEDPETGERTAWLSRDNTQTRSEAAKGPQRGKDSQNGGEASQKGVRGDSGVSQDARRKQEIHFRVEGRPCAYVRMTRGTKWGPRAQRYLAYRGEVSLRAKEAGAEPWPGPVRVHVQAYVKRRTFDLDNLVKCVLDALNKIAFADDKQVILLYGAIGITPNDEVLLVTVQEV